MPNTHSRRECHRGGAAARPQDSASVVTISVWRVPDHRKMRWKNGRGTTYEVATSPDGSGTADFDWRISFADVDTDGPFSSFAGIDRVIVVVEGEQMVLTIDGSATPWNRTSLWGSPVKALQHANYWRAQPAT